MAEWTERAELLFKKEGLERLKNAHVLVVGMGGVGSFAAEFIARAGVGSMTIVDGDIVDITNINRQLPALHSTVNKPKVDIVGDRLMDINPELKLIRIKEFLSPERAYELVTKDYDYVLDCIDSITPKLNLIMSARRQKVKIISNMGAGGKYEASKVKVTDISKTEYCPLAKIIRKRLRREGISRGVKVVFSVESPDETSIKTTDGTNYKKSFYGTNSWMPALFGLHAAETVVKYIINKNSNILA
ncbi:tRNA threonylcarbamoyladenosine dehydratase [Flavobacterium arcticum]|uniref:tRNA threonylcarbamoyladenosine dehydratase n=1 Tax=Flavobacterium arcticum TaxID=1784713 RepID=A0A345HEQ9_9FLAO|nr:tRNA threonylcarbamoyladenosine dehydratase [Flavobacterium arcticum]AXG75069.1 tRNA threonylcarbamoyladenosine dehydratase [Flavobacterium arcticum]KAF2511149.1 tRNA threonylcarbamoyladenosine dehydratase [Flavobacterium arcticum]